MTFIKSEIYNKWSLNSLECQLCNSHLKIMIMYQFNCDMIPELHYIPCNVPQIALNKF